MEGIIKISIFAVLVIMILLPVKRENPMFGVMAGMAIGFFVMKTVLGGMERILAAFDQLSAYLGAAGGFLGLLLKVLAITYVCEFAASICRDAGYGFVAGQLEILGKLSVMVSGISILFALIDQIKNLA